MTSNELKHQAKVQKWGLAIQDCRSSGLSVREWCRQRGITPTTYYRWEREVLSGIGRKDAEGRSGGGEFENVAILVVIAVNEDKNDSEVLGAAEGMKEDKSSWVSFFQ